MKRAEDARQQAEKTKRAFEAIRALEARTQAVENDADAARYDYVPPTSEEVRIAQDNWRRAHPFTLSSEMPDFSRYVVRVPKQQQAISPKPSPAPEFNGATPRPNLSRVQSAAKPRPPNPASITLRKHADGRVTAIIGSQLHRFDSEIEARAYLEKLKVP